MFKVMKCYKYPHGKKVYWVLSNKSLTINNIQFLEGEGWKIVGVENMTDEIKKCKDDFGFDQANIKLIIQKNT